MQKDSFYFSTKLESYRMCLKDYWGWSSWQSFQRVGSYRAAVGKICWKTRCLCHRWSRWGGVTPLVSWVSPTLACWVCTRHTTISVLTLHPWHVPCVALVYHCRGVSADLTTVSTRSIKLYRYNHYTPNTRGVNRWAGVSTLRERWESTQFAVLLVSGEFQAQCFLTNYI